MFFWVGGSVPGKSTLWGLDDQTWRHRRAHIVGVAFTCGASADIVLDKIRSAAGIMLVLPGNTWVDLRALVDHGDGGRRQCRTDHQYRRPSGQTLKIQQDEKVEGLLAHRPLW